MHLGCVLIPRRAADFPDCFVELMAYRLARECIWSLADEDIKFRLAYHTTTVLLRKIVQDVLR